MTAHDSPLLTDEGKPGELTTRILDAALAEFRDYGLKRTSMENVAQRAGIARATIYRRFPSKTELMRVVTTRELRRMMAKITGSVAGLPTVQERLVEGFVATIQSVRSDSLLNRLLESEPETVLPYLTVDAEFALTAVRRFLADQLMRSPEPAAVADHEAVAEVMARLGLSIALSPSSLLRLESDDDLRAFGRRFLLPLLHPID